MHPLWVVSFPEGVSVGANGEGGLVLEGPGGRLVLRRLSPATQDALARLVHPGDSVGRLVAALERSREPHASARFFFCLRRLAVGGLLLVTATTGGERLATLVPTARWFVLTAEGVCDRPCVLSRFAYMHRVGGQIVLESPLSAARILLHDYRAAALVHTLANAAVPAEIGKGVPGLSAEAVTQLVGLLLNAGMLTVVDDDGASAEDEHPSLQSWEFHDLLFHARSRAGRHDAPVGNTYRLVGRLKQPPPVKPVATSETIDLYRPDLNALEDHDPPFVRAVEQRRSIREYAAEPMTLRQLGEFLYRAARIKECYEFEVDTPAGPIRMGLTSRPYPTGGALYALEVYPIVRACGGLDQGLYHYDPLDHRLERISAWTAEVERLSDHAGLAMGVPGDSVQVLLVLAARFQRVSWKYSTLAYSLILKDVGAVMQTMYLVATAMDLAPCALGVGDSDVFARAIGSDYYAETSVGEFALGSTK